MSDHGARIRPAANPARLGGGGGRFAVFVDHGAMRSAPTRFWWCRNLDRTASTCTASAPTRPSTACPGTATTGCSAMPPRRCRTARRHYDRMTLAPELAESWQVASGRHVLHLQAAQGRDLPRRRAGHREGREMVVRPRGEGRRLSDLPDVGRFARSIRSSSSRSTTTPSASTMCARTRCCCSTSRWWCRSSSIPNSQRRTRPMPIPGP